ncbi:hypothetical protein DNTS_021547, partial [Danionella cerebrum]
MSFSRAPLKRFNEHTGCAPPPGAYEVKSGELKGAASFHKAERFKAASKVLPLPSPSKEVAMSPVRRTMSVDGLTNSLNSKKDKGVFTVETKHQRLLEKEQRGEQDRRLLTLEEELRKLESKLLAAVREKTGLAANVASLERQLAELKKANDFLKTKVSEDITKKKINALSMELIEAKNKLDSKEKELSFLHISSEGQVKVLETDLESARTTFRVLQERNKDLEELHQETRAQNEQLENELDRLHGIIQELREETKVMQSYLDSANEEIQDLRIKLQDKSLSESRVSDTQENLSDLEQKLEQRTTELRDCQGALKTSEEELSKSQQELTDSQKALLEKEREVQRCLQDLQALQSSLTELEEKVEQRAQDLEEARSLARRQEQEMAHVKEVLRRTEEELDQRAALMGERCLRLEKERAEIQEDELERLRAETETERRQLGEELEDALDELSELEKKEQHNLEAILQLTQKSLTLEEEVQSSSAQLHKKCSELQALEEAHVRTISKLEEDHKNCLAKLSDVNSDFERTRNALDELKHEKEAQVLQLQEEIYQMKQKLLQDQLQLTSIKEMQDQKQEEHANMLLEVQSKLAEKEGIATAHSEQLRCLQEEVDQERRAREQTQSQLEREQKKRQSLEERTAEISKLLGLLKDLQGELSELRNQVQKERDAAQRHSMEWQEERQQLSKQMEEERQEFHRRIAEVQLQSTSDAETEHWRNLYEELCAKVKPFQEELDRFAVERNALLNEKGATQAELNKLADAYANLMGHHNNRQKIRHMVKLKEENLELKQEVSRLRSQLGKQKNELDRLKSRRTPRLDPSKAFNHEHKENQQPASALTEGESNKDAVTSGNQHQEV